MEFTLLLMTAFFSSLLSIKLVKPVATRWELVDKPNERKQHSGNIPLIGGIATFLGVMISIFLWLPYSQQLNLYVIASALMVFIGALDDRYDLSVRVRIVAQILIASIMIFGAGIYIDSLGDVLGMGNVDIYGLGTVFTLVAVIGAINAFNMVDGIDGLIGGLAINSFASMAILFFVGGKPEIGVFPMIIVMAICPYLLFNLGILGNNFKKIFMGDAGSMFIGFSVIWLLVLGTQGETAVFRPVTALWLIAIPLMDMAAIMFRRIKKGSSPFKPDRDHLHHIFMRSGFSSKQALIILSLLGVLLSTIGVLGEIYSVPEWIMFTGFLCLFLIYSYLIQHIWKVVKFIRFWCTHEEV